MMETGTRSGSVPSGPVTHEGTEKKLAVYRTRRRAEANGPIAQVPDTLALPSLGKYRDAMAILTTKEPDVMDRQPAWLGLILPEMAEHLSYKDETLLYDNAVMPNTDLVNYLDMTPAKISRTDTILLRALYTTILKEVETEIEGRPPDEILALVGSKPFLNDSVTIYLPDLVGKLGGDPASRDAAKAVVSKIKGFANLYGSIEAPMNGKIYHVYRPTVHISEEDERYNTIEITGPHLRKLIAMILQASMKTDGKGHVKVRNSGVPLTLASHSYMIKASIAKERNKRAAEIVCAVVPRIEQAGKYGLSISAARILDLCPGLRCAFDSAGTSSEKTKILRKAFLPAWKMLDTQTRLKEFYKDIEFPSAYPTAAKLNMIFEFRHGGKIADDTPDPAGNPVAAGNSREGPEK